MKKFNIALDGPAGAGKSTVARLLANRLGFIYVDTGAMYRAVTWRILQEGLDVEQAARITAIAQGLELELRPGISGQQVWINGVDVTEEIRSSSVNHHVSQVAQIPEVRHLLVAKQKELAAAKGVVMDGRDIGTHVLPDAEVKVFLTASARARAERRYYESSSPSGSIEEMETELDRRDRIDRERKESPLIKAHDAILVDSTSMELSEVVDVILELCRVKVSGGI